MKKFSVLFLMLLSLALITACQSSPRLEGEEQKDEVSNEPNQAVASSRIPNIEVDLVNAEGVEVGMALLKQLDEGVEITVEASHLPEGLHGFHVHEKGICEPPGFESAGGHFNPTDAEHGFDDPKGPHAGDIHNLEVQADGTVNQTFFNDMITMKPGEVNSLFSEAGTAFVIHADPDDYVSQPAGDAGDRIVCGVIVEQGKE